MSSPGGLSFAPDQLARLSGCPAIDSLLIHDFADLQCILLSGDSLADIDIVDATTVPDADVALSADALVEDFADFFGGLALDTHDADLPAGLIFHDFTVAEGQTLVFCDIANGANIDPAISDVLHNY